MRYTVIFLLATLVTAIFAFGDILNGPVVAARAIFATGIILFLVAFYKEALAPAPTPSVIRHK
jgi:uncharacterized membrane protein YtjA (UPF0391 family)